MVTFTKEIKSCFDCPDRVSGYEGRACCKHFPDRRYGMEWRSEGVRDDCPYKKQTTPDAGGAKSHTSPPAPEVCEEQDACRIPAMCPEVTKAAKAAREQVLNVRPEVRRFAELMEAKLKKNDHKSHWSKESFTYLFGRLDDEMKELNQAVSSAKTNNGRIADEAVDVANFLMMIVDNFESLRAQQQGGVSE